MFGDLLIYDCFDEGNVFGIGCLVDVKFFFKVNVKVMIVWNFLEDVKNGIIGMFIGMIGDKLEVVIFNYGRVLLKR